ncbi:hypothetical protein M9H77_03776 [Catharanthus roseus]|uniref:Uncharacterized protein n=1 Tax=Catharanthus roseus TaxID=4058 RepID=A0ACC0CCM3_CATRO|nr:hypothetical protein M9H77_03776 [Catharanthus roseus]
MDIPSIVRGSKKKRTHPDSSTPPAVASIPPVTSASPMVTSTPLTAASTPLMMFTPTTTVSIPSATLTLFPQLPYSSLAPISIPSSSASAVETSSRSAPSLSAPPPRRLQQAIGMCKDYFKNYEAALCREKVSMRPRHEGPIQTAWEKWTSARYKDLMYDIRIDGLYGHWNSNPYKKKWEAAKVNRLQGRGKQRPTSTPAGLSHSLSGGRKQMKYLHSLSCTSSYLSKRDSRWICVSTSQIFRVKGKCRTSLYKDRLRSPSHEQLIFEAAGGSNNDHVYGFGSQSGTYCSGSSSSVSFVSSTTTHECYIERDKQWHRYMAGYM